MVSHSRVVIATLLLITSVVVCPSTAVEQKEPIWPVKHKLRGEDEGKSKDVKYSKDVSGIACASDTGFPRACLVIDDDLQSAQLVTLNDKEIVAGEPIRLIDDTYEGKPLELDGEGVAYANGFFYIIGSHGHPRNKELKKPEIRARIAASSQLIRLRVDSDSGKVLELTRTSKLREFVMADPTLGPFVDQRLEKNGVTIEGVAVRNDRLFAGFRGPVVKNKNNDSAVILSVSLGALFDGQPPDAKLHLLSLGQGQGVRDLAPYADGLLVLAGPTAEPKGGKYSVYWWDITNDKSKLLKHLPIFFRENKGEKEIKPEAILFLDQTSTDLRVLIMFDGAQEGEPRAIKVPKP